MKLYDSIVTSLKEYFHAKPVLKAYLDILVELDYSKPIGLEFIQMQLDLQNLLHRKVDLVTTRAISRHLRPFIEKEKILIYER